MLNRPGRYMTFFLKLNYVEPASLTRVDMTSGECDARICHWWRADELLVLDAPRFLGRLCNPRFGSHAAGLCSFHVAVCKTLMLESSSAAAHQLDHQRWQSTAIANARVLREAKEEEKEEEKELALYMARTALACASTPPPGGGSRSRRAAEARRSSSRGKSRKRSRHVDLRDFSP